MVARHTVALLKSEVAADARYARLINDPHDIHAMTKNDRTDRGAHGHDGTLVYGLSRRRRTKPTIESFDLSAWNARSGKPVFVARTPDEGINPDHNFTLQESLAAPRLLVFQGSDALVCDSRTGEPIAGSLTTSPRSSQGYGFISRMGDEVHLAATMGLTVFRYLDGAYEPSAAYAGEYAHVTWSRSGKTIGRVSSVGDAFIYDRRDDLDTRLAAKLNWCQSLLIDPSETRLLVNDVADRPDRGTGLERRILAGSLVTKKVVWERAGFVAGFGKPGEVLVLEWPSLFVTDVLTGETMRSFRLETHEGSY